MTANPSLLYTVKATSAFLVPLANVPKGFTGTWKSVLVAAVPNVVVHLALFVLRLLRANQRRRAQLTTPSQE